MIHEKAKTAPMTFNGQLHTYVCHSACMYWALQAFLKTTKAEDVAKLLDKSLGKLCPKCLGENPNSDCHAIERSYYAKLFKEVVKPYYPDKVSAGDVILLGNVAGPTHSMVCAETDTKKKKVWVRGFNNQGTFGLDKKYHNTFDKHLRDMDTRNPYLKDEPLYYVQAQAYIDTIVKWVKQG